VRLQPSQVLFRDPASGNSLQLQRLENDRGLTFAESVRELQYQTEVARNARAKREDLVVPEESLGEQFFKGVLERAKVRLGATAAAAGRGATHPPRNVPAQGIRGGYFYSRKEHFGRRHVRVAWETASNDMLKIVTPATGLANVKLQKRAEFDDLYAPVPELARARQLWNESLARHSLECIHGANCQQAKTPSGCK
jgi:hypothetical protein